MDTARTRLKVVPFNDLRPMRSKRCSSALAEPLKVGLYCVNLALLPLRGHRLRGIHGHRHAVHKGDRTAGSRQRGHRVPLGHDGHLHHLRRARKPAGGGGAVEKHGPRRAVSLQDRPRADDGADLPLGAADQAAQAARSGAGCRAAIDAVPERIVSGWVEGRTIL